MSDPKTDELKFDLGQLDIKNFARELEAIRRKLEAEADAKDFQHLLKIERWGRVCSAVGLFTSALIPNPLSAWLICQGRATRWTILAHHVLHKGYDRLPKIPERYTSKGFAKGWRRWIDWFDWVHPEAWHKEHNVLHHYRLGERFDPDIVEKNIAFLRRLPIPKAIKLFLISGLAATWRFAYYAPSTMKQLYAGQKTDDTPRQHDRLLVFDPVFLPWSKAGKSLWLSCYFPFTLWHFIALPLCFLPFGKWAAISVLCNQILAEIFTNLYTFLTIVPNHAGDDIYRFREKIDQRAEFFIRQITGSANYKTGGDINDFLHGWLNYQIEHHVWPDLTLRQYQRAQPLLRALCDKYGVPYVQNSVWVRLKKTLAIMVGNESMLVA